MHEQKASNVPCLTAVDKVTLPECTHIIEGNYHHHLFISIKIENYFHFLNKKNTVSVCSLSGCPRRDKMTPESKFFSDKICLLLLWLFTAWKCMSLFFACQLFAWCTILKIHFIRKTQRRPLHVHFSHRCVLFIHIYICAIVDSFVHVNVLQYIQLHSQVRVPIARDSSTLCQ